MSDFTELNPQQAAKAEAVIRELERKANDDILVYNPTDEDVYQTYDRRKHGPIPNRNKDVGFGKGKTVLPRPIAESYIKDMYYKILFAEQDKAIADEQDRRAEAGIKLMERGDDQNAYINKLGLNETPERKKHIVTKLYGGIYKEFGRDFVASTENSYKKDTSDFYSLINEVEKERVTPVTEPITNPSKKQTKDNIVEEIE